MVGPSRGHRPAPRSRKISVKPVVLVLGSLGLLAWGASLFVHQTLRWAGDHPVGTVVAALVALPVLVVLVRGMPSARELRREMRKGMAEADAEAGSAYEETGAAPPHTGPAGDAAVLHALDADAFERAVAELCERDGCIDVHVVGGAGDLGADVLARTPDGLRVVIQCKRYAEDNKVGSQDVQRFGGTCYVVHEADIAVLVTTSTFTEPAAAYAWTVGIRCCDGPSLAGWYGGTEPPPWMWEEDGADDAGLPAPDRADSEELTTP